MSQHPIVPTPGSNIIQQVNTLIQTGNKILQQAEGTYSAKIRRDQPTALVFLIDQSGSMGSGQLNIDGVVLKKKEAAARIINSTLEELLKRSTKDAELRDYIHFAIIGYGVKDAVNMAWSGKLAGKTWVSTNELKENATKTKITFVTQLPDGTKEEEKIETNTWFEPVADGGTPMHGAIIKATDLVSKWIADGRSNSFPPIIINITDGEATDAQPQQLLEAAEKLKKLRTDDGHVLFLNCHLSKAEGNSVIFPSDIGELPDDKFAKLMFNMSSVMPSKYHEQIQQAKKTVSANNYKGMSFNADGSHLVKFITIGSSY